MNSLKVKILGLTIGITVVAILLATWHNLHTQSGIIKRIAIHETHVISETIRNSIRTSMAAGRNKDVSITLKKIASKDTISDIRVITPSGKILLSANDDELGEVADANDLIPYRLNPEGFSFMPHTDNLFISTLPIFNENTCHRCHGKQNKVLGILNIHLSLEGLSSLQRDGRKANIIFSLVIILILIFSSSYFLLYYVDSPIRQMVKAMTMLEKGRFNEAMTDISSSHEMSTLSKKFNDMVKRLQSLIDTTVRQERESAINHEKLTHKSQIEGMNLTLEERLHEIENLNITLEERIEEVEDANFKIADLASELEDRNTNLSSAVSRLSALYKMGLAINSTMNRDQLFNQLLQKTAQALNAHIGYLLLLNKDRQSLRVGAVIGLHDSDYDRTKAIALTPGGVSHWVIKNREPLLIRDIEESREISRMSRLGFARETVLCAPLFVQNEIFGTLTMANRQDGEPFNEEDLELLSTIAAQASVAIKNAQLYEEQQNTYLNTVQALVSAIEASDPYTRGHSERVTRYTLAIANAMKLPESSFKDLEQAAILHDIGKIGIDGSLLHKAGILSPQDIEQLRQHPTIGMHILEPIQFMTQVRKILGQHHERFDGLGYPMGLSGEKLLVEARILAVADSYDAMTSDRPYRKALSLKTAIRELKENAGTQFDPQVVAVFIQIINEKTPRGG